MSEFILTPCTMADFRKNINFQMANVEGYLSIEDYVAALIKAQCLVDAIKAIVEAEEARPSSLR